ncbi:caspase-7-like [Antedon mediterranea]|uniref:caspase-7-like n=1 Tax=Antedon mediterranea TaxID=105859 RepID=UPI003AF7278C
MEAAHKKILRTNRITLVSDMPMDILNELVARQIFNTSEDEKYRSMNGTTDRNTAILNDIVRKGPKAFRALAESLFATEVYHLATLLIPDLTEDTLYDLSYYEFENDTKAPMQPSVGDKPPVQQSVAEGSGDFNPTRKFPTQVSEAWPQKTADEVLQMKMSKGNYTSEMTDSPQNYTIKSKPRGKALIVNNRNFRSMPLRKGTDVDARQLECLFTQLAFEVENLTNSTYSDFYKKLRHYSTMNHSRYDCFIIAVLTHGVNGALYSVDERLIKVDDIQNCFTGDSCPSLTGKPKLFFIQACRGEMFDQGVEATDGPSANEGSSVDPDIHSLNINGDVDNPENLVNRMLKIEFDETDAIGSKISKLPSHSDMLLAYATVPGYVSWRNSERGSWFVQALTETFLQHAREEDLLSMLTMVNNKVARAFESSSGRNKQMPAPVTMLTKKLFFFPGHYEA